MSVSFAEDSLIAAARAGDFRRVLEPKAQLIEAIRDNAAVREGDPREALGELTALAARMLELGRLGAWVLDEPAGKLVCLDLYVAQTGRHTSGATVSKAEAPQYFALLLDGEVLTVDDAAHDPRTRELARSYLPAHDIGAVIVWPILIERKLAGALVGEHLGAARRWEGWERLLGSTLAEVAGVAIDLARHAEAEGTRGRWRRLSVG